MSSDDFIDLDLLPASEFSFEGLELKGSEPMPSEKIIPETLMPFEKIFPDTLSTSEVINRRDFFPTDRQLVIGGCEVEGLAREYGTPLYVLDEDTLRNRCRSFRQEFDDRCPGTQVVYAAKAYINPALAQIFVEEGLGLDVVSGGELAVAAAAEFPMERIYFHGNNKSYFELHEAVQQGVGRVVVDSFQELETLNDIASIAGHTQDILIRVSPGIDPHTHAYTTTGIIDSKFGFSIQTGDAARAVRKALELPRLNLVGLHFHLGSPIFELAPYAAATDLVLRFAASLRDAGLDLQEFSPGGGFAIAYTRDQEPPAIAAYAETIVSTLRATCAELDMPIPKLLIEPGRAIIGPAGVALYRVGAIKDIPGVRKYVSVDGGMGDNIRPALYQAHYEVVSATRLNRTNLEQVTIAGKYCESGDVLAADVMLPTVWPGDLIAMPAAGAYCPSMASNYNLNPRPPIVLVKDGESRLIRRGERADDMMRCDVAESYDMAARRRGEMEYEAMAEWWAEEQRQQQRMEEGLRESYEQEMMTGETELYDYDADYGGHSPYDEWSSEESRWVGF